MNKNLKIRFFTSIVLLLTLFFMAINTYVLAYILIITGILAFLEFSKIIKIIYIKKKIKAFFYNLSFLIFLFAFCSFFLLLSSYFHLKIILFIILVICIGSDIGGFVIGKTFKGPKLTKISPNKTILGSIGSLVFSASFGVIMIYFLTKNIDPLIFFVSLITSVACQIGDLFFSYLKRKSNLKDTGTFLPGHGGILDRIDGILFGLPLGFLTLLIFN